LLLSACSGEPAKKPGDVSDASGRVALLLPGKVTMNKTAPDMFRVNFETSKGAFVVEVHRDWSPNGSDRFYYLVKNGFYDDNRFFRVISGFMAQVGLNGDPKVSGVWRDNPIPDDSVKQSNARGMVTFAKAGPNTRTTQIFINYKDNGMLDRDGF